MRRWQRVWLYIILVSCALGACTRSPGETGILQGVVTVGPLVPVVGPGVQEPTPGPEVFAGRKVVIFDARGRRELRQVDLSNDGSYRVELEVGSYQVDINYLGIDHAAGLPALVEIQAGQTTTLDIDIDTGIR